MRCAECGAVLPGDESCLDRFHALLAAEVDNRELARMHGLTVLTYHVQHPSRTKPWIQVAGYAALRRAFNEGQDWLQVLREENQQARVNRLKASVGATMPPGIATGPVEGELTVAAVDPTAPSGQAEIVLAWARSVAAGRVSNSAAASTGARLSAGRRSRAGTPSRSSEARRRPR